MAFFCALLFCSCDNDVTTEPRQGHRIGYRLLVNEAIAQDSSSSVPDPITQGVLELMRRTQGHPTQIHAAWSQWPSIALQDSMLAYLRQSPGSKISVILDSLGAVHSADSITAQPFISQSSSSKDPFVVVQNATSETYPLPNGDTESRQMHNNFMLFRNLASSKSDDGQFGILFFTNPLQQQPAQRQFAEAVWLYGDSILYARLLAYWHGLAEGQGSSQVNQSHTFSNLHDHLLWFFPDANASAVPILDQLEVGLAETKQPAKVRLVLPAIDRCHIDFASKLKALQARYELDLQVVLSEGPETEIEIVQLWSGMPSLRFFPVADSLGAVKLSARFLLNDGPYSVGDNAPAEARRLCFFFGDDLDLPSMEHHCATWLRVMDRDLFEAAEEHFAKIWAASTDTISKSSNFRHHPCE